MQSLAPLALTILLSGCVTGTGENRLAFLDVSSARGCTVRAQNRPFVLPGESVALEVHLASLATRHSGALIAAAEPVPDFRCRAAFMLSLRKAGFRRLGFVDDFDGPAPPG